MFNMIWKQLKFQKLKIFLYSIVKTPSEIVFQEQSYFSLHSGRSLGWDHFRGDIDDPCSVIADFCGVIGDFCGVIADPCDVVADPCDVVAIPEEIGGRRCDASDRCATH